MNEAIVMETVSLKNLPKNAKIELLKQLGYKVEGKYILDSNGIRVKDKYSDIEVIFSNMLILPGSTLILDDNPLSIAAYLDEYGDVL